MHSVTRTMTADGRAIYAVPVQAFSELVTNVYVISDGNALTLVDCGSGLEQSNADLVAGLAAIETHFGEPVRLADIDHIVITHGHVDHFGGLPFVRQHNPTAPIWVHILDRRVLSNHDERVVMAASRLRTFLGRAGVPDAKRDQLMQVYLFSKGYYRSLPVQHLLEDGQTVLDGVRVHHVPGHSPGLVCLQVDDVLLTSDHVLSRTTPHQAPESITLNMGLTHYFQSLEKIAAVDGVRLGLGGHEAPIEDVGQRVRQIRAMHEARLERVLALCCEPASIADISKGLFGTVQRYHVLLALEEAGAHAEYLYQRGLLVAANVSEISADSNAVVRYVCP